MSNTAPAMVKEITPDILYIGADDLQIEKFENQYIVPEGMAYNSYVIMDGKIAVMDTVDSRSADKWKENLINALEDRTPDYLVVHHMEPDHSSLIAWALDSYKDMTLLASAKAIQMLGQFFPGKDYSERCHAVREGEEVSLGRATLRFMAAPMVHWPEVMVSYEVASGTLFSADAFGKFGALSREGFYADEEENWACEARRYYFNICGKYGMQVQALLRKVSELDVQRICSLHGPVIRKDLEKYVSLYDTWSKYGVETEGVFVAYASIHGGTAEVAKKVAQMLLDRGEKKVAVSDLCYDDPAECVEDAFRYGKMVLAACSYDAGLFPPAYEFIHHLQDKAYQNRKVALIENGSWAPSAGRVMKEMFSSMKNVQLVGETVTIKSRLREEDIPSLEALADAIHGC